MILLALGKAAAAHSAGSLSRRVADGQAAVAIASMRRGDTQQFFQSLTSAAITSRLLRGADQQFELMMAITADVFVNWQNECLRKRLMQIQLDHLYYRINLVSVKSCCQFASRGSVSSYDEDA